MIVEAYIKTMRFFITKNKERIPIQPKLPNKGRFKCSYMPGGITSFSPFGITWKENRLTA